MVINFKYGIKFDNILYGRKHNKLYRLPQMIGTRFYPMKELKMINVGNTKGYYIGRKRKSVRQLEDMTEEINFRYKRIKNREVWF